MLSLLMTTCAVLMALISLCTQLFSFNGYLCLVISVCVKTCLHNIPQHKTNLSGLISIRRFSAYSLDSNPFTGTSTLLGSALYQSVSAKLNDSASIRV